MGEGVCPSFSNEDQECGGSEIKLWKLIGARYYNKMDNPRDHSVNSEDTKDLLAYINNEPYPVATIMPTMALTNYHPAPVIASFSSRGPSYLKKNILKPDISARGGVDILVAFPPNTYGGGRAPVGREDSYFMFLLKTSTAIPHVSANLESICYTISNNDNSK